MLSLTGSCDWKVVIGHFEQDLIAIRSSHFIRPADFCQRCTLLLSTTFKISFYAFQPSNCDSSSCRWDSSNARAIKLLLSRGVSLGIKSPPSTTQTAQNSKQSKSTNLCRITSNRIPRNVETPSRLKLWRLYGNFYPAEISSMGTCCILRSRRFPDWSGSKF